MTKTMLRGAALVVALAGAGCQTVAGHMSASPASYVAEANVVDATGEASASFPQEVRAKTLEEGSRFGFQGAPKRLDITVTQLHKKNPVLSALVADSNSVSATVAVTDMTSGAAEGGFKVTALDSYALNGVVGAVQAVAQDQAEFEGRIAGDLARETMVQMYGTQAAKRVRAVAPRPVPPLPGPATASAAADAAEGAPVVVN